MPQLMVKGANAQFALHRFEGSLDLRQLYVALPQDRRIFPYQIGAQQIVTILQLSRPQLGLVDSEAKVVAHDRFTFARDMDLQETINTACSFPCRADAQQQLVPARTTLLHGAQLAQQPRQFLPPHSSFLGPSSFALGQHIELAGIGKQLHFQPHPAPSAKATPAISSHTVGSCCAAFPPGRKRHARKCASPPAPLRSESRDPSPTRAAPGRSWPRSCPESCATWFGPTCSRP